MEQDQTVARTLQLEIVGKHGKKCLFGIRIKRLSPKFGSNTYGPRLGPNIKF